MASGSTSSLLGSSDETRFGMKLMRLILDGGTEALRKVFQRIHTGNLQVVLSCKSSLSTCTSSTCNYCCLIAPKKRKIINQNQWDKLFPAPPNKPNINDFDITLLSVLLRNICGLSPPSTGWDNLPTASDLSEEADIVRIKFFRNKHFGHRPQSAVSEADFKALWAEICFYALFVILHKIKYLLSNKLFINVLSLSVLMPRPWSHFAPFFVTVTTEQINTTVILIFYNNHIYMQHLFFS